MRFGKCYKLDAKHALVSLGDQNIDDSFDVQLEPMSRGRFIYCFNYNYTLLIYTYSLVSYQKFYVQQL